MGNLEARCVFGAVATADTADGCRIVRHTWEKVMRFGLFGSAQSSSESLDAGVGWGFHDYINYNVETEALGC
jgi:hypothetical protein